MPNAAFAAELLLTIALAYVVTEYTSKRPSQRWTLIRALHPAAILECCTGGLLFAVLGVLILLFLILSIAFAQPSNADHMPPAQRAALAEAKADAVKELLAIGSFTLLAYADLRSRCVSTRLSWLWFLRAAVVAALKTMCYLAPLVAFIVILPFLLLCSLLDALGLHVIVELLTHGPGAYLLRYAPYVSVYYVIQSQFNGSRAAQLPLLPTAAGGKGHATLELEPASAASSSMAAARDDDDDREAAPPTTMLGRWLGAIRRDVNLDAALRQADSANGGAGHGCGCQACLLALLALGLTGFVFLVMIMRSSLRYGIRGHPLLVSDGQGHAFIVTEEALDVEGEEEEIVLVGS